MASGANFMDDVIKKASKGLNDASDFLKNLDDITFTHTSNGAKTVTKLKSNEGINSVYEFFMGASDSGIRGTLNNMANGDNFGQAIKSAYTTAEGGLNYKAIAGTYIGGSLIGRAATGGGLYRDQTGNVNMPGVPFL